MDIKFVFLNEKVEKEIYMDWSKGYGPWKGATGMQTSQVLAWNWKRNGRQDCVSEKGLGKGNPFG